MQPRKMLEPLDWVGAVDWDRRLFDALIPLPDGTSYNSYLLRGSGKTALLDTVDPPMAGVLLERLKNSGVKSIDYVVTHHAEQDHSGSLPLILERYPEAQVLASVKGKPMLLDLLELPEARVRAVKDGEEVSLGDLTLRFMDFPWVHWPETMLSWVPELKVLFPCDLFGSHLATSELYAKDEGRVLAAAKRYYAEIMMPFRPMIAKNLPKLKELGIGMIAPSHGPAYARPALIMDAYEQWLSDRPENLAAVAYISMHDSTRRMVDRLVEALTARGVKVERFDLADADIGKLAMTLVDAATLVVASPTVLGGPHPKAAYAALLANALRPKTKFLSVIGSYGWGGRMAEQLASMTSGLKAELIPPVLVKGAPRAADLASMDKLAEEIAKRHAAL